MRTPCFILKSFPYSTDGIDTHRASAGSVARIPTDLVEGLTQALYTQPVCIEGLKKIGEGEGKATLGGVLFAMSFAECQALVEELGLTAEDFAPAPVKLPDPVGSEIKMLAGAEENKAVAPLAISADDTAALAERVADVSATSSDVQAEVIDAAPTIDAPVAGLAATVEVRATAEPREAQRAVDIPADWRKLKWNDLSKLAARVSSAAITNQKSAVAAIEAELQLRAEGK